MSKLKAAIFTAILGTSTAAMASPSLSWSADAQFSWGNTGAPVIRDHRTTVTPAAYHQAPSSSAFIKLAGYLDLAEGRDMLRLNQDLRDANSLTLRANSGMGYIEKVVVRYRRGRSEVISVNQWMTSRRAAITVPLHGNRAIDSIMIVGSPSGRLSYQVFASVDNVEMPRPPVYQPPVYQPQPQPPVYQPPVYQPRGLELGRDMSFLGTDGRRFFNLGHDKGTFNTLRLEGNSGSTYVQMVKIEFTNGQVQFMGAINKTLGRNQILDLPLDKNGGIQQIVVWTSDNGTSITNSTGTFNASVL
jgi:hypothetical protein